MSESKKKLDPVAELIVEMVAALKPGKSISPNEVAEEFAIRKWKPVTPPPGEWRSYLDTAKQQAIYLARQKKIILIRKGKPMDLSQPIKGVIRLGQAPPPVE
jgi:uncharacterized protein DUF3253